MASLKPNKSVLGPVLAQHLLRRASFVYSKAVLDQFSVLTAAQALDLLVEKDRLIVKLPYDPYPDSNPDGFWTESADAPQCFIGHDRKKNIVTAWWWYNAIHSPTLQYKMSHFLSTRFTVQKSACRASTYFYDYLQLLLFYSEGNYKDLAQKMTTNSAMLYYLNNNTNSKKAPNENYAREFLELFTIGKGAQIADGNYTNYTEEDVVQAARVLTGFRVKLDRSVVDATTGIPTAQVVFAAHDPNPKVFSAAFQNTIIEAATAANGMHKELEDFIAMVFNQKATAQNICRKLYQYFVKSTISVEIENDIIKPLAKELFQNGYEIKPIMRKLLESKHFYDLEGANKADRTLGSMIKSPLQQLSEIASYFEASIPDPRTNPTAYYIDFWQNFVSNTFLIKADMNLFNPESVAGHPAYYQAPTYDKNWISSVTLLARYRLGESLLDGKNRIKGGGSTAVKINILEGIKSGTLISNALDPYTITTEFCSVFFGQVPDANLINFFMNTYLLQGHTSDFWTQAWNSYLTTNKSTVVEPRLKLLLSKILSAPESLVC